MRVENEWTENGMYEISEADDNPEFIAWLRNKRAMDKIRQQERKIKDNS